MKKMLTGLFFIFFSLLSLQALEAPAPKGYLLIKNNFNYRTGKKISLPAQRSPLQNAQSISLFSSTALPGVEGDDEMSDDEKIGIYYKGENLLRRAEILFFGSLTIVSFLSWISFSVFNVLVYDEPFGVLKRHQYLALYLGSSVISLSVSISDLLIRLNRPLKKRNIKVFD